MQEIKISDESISEFQAKLKFLKPLAVDAFDILDGIIYILYKNNVKITWGGLKKKVEVLIRKNLNNHIYDCFEGIFIDGSIDTVSSFETYFLSRPVRMGLDLTGRYFRVDTEKKFIEGLGWEKFLAFIEKKSLPRLAAGPTYHITNVILIAQDLVKLISDMADRKLLIEKKRQIIWKIMEDLETLEKIEVLL